MKKRLSSDVKLAIGILLAAGLIAIGIWFWIRSDSVFVIASCCGAAG